MVTAVFLIAFLALGVSSEIKAIPDEDWGYVNVRQDANMFWWLYGMQDASKRSSAPLVVWLQGGPGASSTGYGNFEEIGPLDVNLKPRPINWVQSANVLFIDNPVGTGYSYVTSDSAYATTDVQIGQDLVQLMKAFLQKNPTFASNDFWIFCESYGGKMTTAFGVALDKAIKAGQINMTFKGVALGDSWISPVDYVLTWGDYLLATSEVDQNGHDQITNLANLTRDAVTAQQWSSATNLWGETEDIIESVTANVNFYNILDRTGSDLMKRESIVSRHLKVYQQDPLDALMNGKIKDKLNIPDSVTWGGQAGNVFTAMTDAFMQPIVDGVDYLLQAGKQVVVYNGNLDLICCTPGTRQWIRKLKWPGLPTWQDSVRNSITNSQGIVIGFSKAYKNFAYYDVLDSGHMVAADQPYTGQTILNQTIYNNLPPY